jgi:hypothetical protein
MEKGLPTGNHEVADSLAIKDLQGLQGTPAGDILPVFSWKFVQSETAEAASGIAGIVNCELAKPWSSFLEKEAERIYQFYFPFISDSSPLGRGALIILLSTEKI